MKLDVPFVRQVGKACGPTSLQQILRYYGIDNGMEEILRSVKMFSFGTPTVYLAMGAKKMGLDVKIVTLDVDYVDPSWKGITGDVIAGKLRERLKLVNLDENIRLRTEGLAEALESGVELEIEAPSKEILINNIKKGVPPIITVSYNILHGRMRKTSAGNRDDVKGFPDGHFVVVNGYDEKNFIITDSSIGTIEVSHERLMLSWFFMGGWILIIKPNKVKKK
jgi:hypothetical protein